LLQLEALTLSLASRRVGPQCRVHFMLLEAYAEPRPEAIDFDVIRLDVLVALIDEVRVQGLLDAATGKTQVLKLPCLIFGPKIKQKANFLT
jgi:hypothetical protein